MSKMEKGQSENPAVPYSGHHTMGMMLVYGYPSHLFPPVKSESYYDGFSIYWLLILVSRLPDHSLNLLWDFLTRAVHQLQYNIYIQITCRFIGNVAIF